MQLLPQGPQTQQAHCIQDVPLVCKKPQQATEKMVQALVDIFTSMRFVVLQSLKGKDCEDSGKPQISFNRFNTSENELNMTCLIDKATWSVNSSKCFPQLAKPLSQWSTFCIFMEISDFCDSGVISMDIDFI